MYVQDQEEAVYSTRNPPDSCQTHLLRVCHQHLQVDPSASHEEIRQAYKKQARAHHPDKHDHHNKETAENRFKDIGEAFAVLGDPHERAQYDMNREGPRRSRFSPPADQPPRGEAAGTWPMPGFGRFSPFEHDPFFQAPFGRGSMFGSDFFGGSLFGNMFGGGGGARQNLFNGFMRGEGASLSRL